MNLVIVHYHLNRGGVTRVIENQLAALSSAAAGGPSWRVAILYGGRREGFNEQLASRLPSVELSLHEIPELEYDHLPRTSDRGGPAELLMAVMVVLGELGFSPADTLIHVHNHSLGKNAALPEVLPILAEDGYALLLEPHDFAEDFRPENYVLVRRMAAEGTLYPQAPHIHYAVLNARDQAILGQSGIPAGRLHLLPNPVPELASLPPRDEARVKLAERFGIPADARFLLSPVRCIRRKNIGEVLLMACAAPDDTVFGITLAPLNPVEMPYYQRWKRLAGELNLRCRFEVGGPDGLSFRENRAAADAIVTTSVAEGFGMATLEAWLVGCPLIGRDLPEINADFRNAGMQLDGLNPRLAVPVDWIGREAFCECFAAVYRRTLDAFGQPVPSNLAEHVDAKIVDGRVDFADLNSDLQEQVIRIVCGNRARIEELLAGNPWLGEAMRVTRASSAEQIAANVAVIEKTYSLEPSGQRLVDVYRATGEAPRDRAPEPLENPGGLLARFLTPGRFRPIRLE